MTKFLPAFIWFFIFSSSTYCQTDKWAVTFTPCYILSSPVPLYGIQPGAEYRINSRFSLLTEITFTVEKQKESKYSNSEYWRVKPELRYHFLNQSSLRGNYVGFQFSYTHRRWDNLSSNVYYHKTEYEDSCTGYKSATISSPIFTASIQTGYLVAISDRFTLDIFYGIGLRKIFTDYSNVENALKQDNYFRTCSPIHVVAAYRYDHTISRFHLNGGLRLIFYL
jgi:hypothetical protein